MEISRRGYWDGLVNHHTDKGILKRLVELTKQDTSVVDFGCGDASYAKAIKQVNGIQVDAFDGNPKVKELSNNFASQLDLSEEFDLGTEYDTVISLEVAEHIPKEFEEVYLSNIIKHTRNQLIISWAIPGQGGKGHVNEQLNEYVIDTVTNLGFTYDKEMSSNLRNSVTNCNWFKNTIFVFNKINNE